MENVRFYKLTNLPGFDITKHVRIFVHVTGTTAITTDNGGYLMAVGKTFADWAEENHYDEIIPSGLWFGGANGWELLTNDTSSGAIDAAIAALDVEGYAQAEITNAANSNISTLSIKGIKEVDGIISIDGDSNFNIEIDGVYNANDNKIATQTTVTNAVTNAINDLNVETINTVEQTAVSGGTQLTFKGVKEQNGKIAQGDSNNPLTVTVGDGKLSIGNTEVFSANATTNKNITLGSGLTFDGSELGLVLNEGIRVDETNPLVTQNEIASLAGAMHYEGTVTEDEFSGLLGSSETEAGDVYIATETFTHGDNTIQPGDMIVFGGNRTYTVIQSNISLGNQDRQVAANDGALTANKLVIATDNGIGTTNSFTFGEASSRTISAVNYTTDGAVPVHGGVVTDTITVLGQERIASLKIGSGNNSIVVNASNDGNEATFTVDLIWKETI